MTEPLKTDWATGQRVTAQDMNVLHARVNEHGDALDGKQDASGELSAIAEIVDDGFLRRDGGAWVSSALAPEVNAITASVNARIEHPGVDWAGDGSASRAALQALIDDCAGEKSVKLPIGRYRLGDAGGGANRVTVTSGTHLIGEEGAVLEVNAVDGQANTAIVYGAGTEDAKADLGVDADAGDQIVTLPEGHGFATGDLFGIESGREAGDYDVGPWYQREIRQVIKVDGNDVHLDVPLEYTYTVSEDAQFWKINPIENIVIDGLTFEPGPDVTPGVDGSYSIRLKYAKNVHIRNVTIRDMIGGIYLYDCYNVTIDNVNIDRLPFYESAYAYGIALAGSTSLVWINNLHGSDMRHLFTTLADARTGPTFWGEPMHIQINNGIGYGSPGGLSIWDTHEFGRHIEFNNCQAIGGGATVSGFQMRAKHVALNNCRAHRNGLRGLALAIRSEHISVRGGDFGYAGSQGISVNGENHQIIGAWVHDNAGAGIAIAASTDLTVQSCVLTDNVYGIQDNGTSGSTRARIKDCFIPKSTKQTVSLAALSPTAVVQDAVCLGYGSTSAGLASTASGAIWSALTDAGRVTNSPLAVSGTGNTATLAGSAAGAIPSITVTGSDTNVSFQLIMKGDGTFWIYQPSGSNIKLRANGAATDIGINLQTKGAGTVQANGNPVGVKVSVPASASATGVPGQWAADSNYVYYCTAANTWVRAAVATWS